MATREEKPDQEELTAHGMSDRVPIVDEHKSVGIYFPINLAELESRSQAYLVDGVEDEEELRRLKSEQ